MHFGRACPRVAGRALAGAVPDVDPDREARKPGPDEMCAARSRSQRRHNGAPVALLRRTGRGRRCPVGGDAMGDYLHKQR